MKHQQSDLANVLRRSVETAANGSHRATNATRRPRPHNESVGKPKNLNFQRRNSLIPMTTILEESAKFDFSYRLNAALSGAATVVAGKGAPYHRVRLKA